MKDQSHPKDYGQLAHRADLYAVDSKIGIWVNLRSTNDLFDSDWTYSRVASLSLKTTAFQHRQLLPDMPNHAPSDHLVNPGSPVNLQRNLLRLRRNKGSVHRLTPSSARDLYAVWVVYLQLLMVWQALSWRQSSQLFLATRLVLSRDR